MLAVTSFAADPGATRSVGDLAKDGASPFIINLTTGEASTPSGRHTARSMENASGWPPRRQVDRNAAANYLDGSKGDDHIEGQEETTPSREESSATTTTFSTVVTGSTRVSTARPFSTARLNYLRTVRNLEPRTVRRSPHKLLRAVSLGCSGGSPGKSSVDSQTDHLKQLCHTTFAAAFGKGGEVRVVLCLAASVCLVLAPTANADPVRHFGTFVIECGGEQFELVEAG